jgi:hypothetical protein
MQSFSIFASCLFIVCSRDTRQLLKRVHMQLIYKHLIRNFIAYKKFCGNMQSCCLSVHFVMRLATCHPKTNKH